MKKYRLAENVIRRIYAIFYEKSDVDSLVCLEHLRKQGILGHYTQMLPKNNWIVGT